MMTVLDGVRQDALGEAGNIGAGSAARAMEALVGSGGRLSPTRVGTGMRPMGAVEIGLPLAEPFEGEILIVLNAAAASRLLREMNGEGGQDLTRLRNREISTLREAANILGCAYLTGLGETTDLFLRPLPPIMRMGGWPSEPAHRFWIASRLLGEGGFEVELVLCLGGTGASHLLKGMEIR